MAHNIEKKWQVLPTISEEIAGQLKDFSPLTRQVLFNRKIFNSSEAVTYLSAARPADTDPFRLLGMDAAVA
ncbi:MAG: hypothetical protein WCF08_00945, partial [Anaerolineaceae bacterium]